MPCLWYEIQARVLFPTPHKAIPRQCLSSPGGDVNGIWYLMKSHLLSNLRGGSGGPEGSDRVYLGLV